MALKFLNKKGWHTGSLRNLENVWKAEQKHEAEQKKLEELKVQIHKEREAEELRQQYQAAGLAPKQDRLEFLYDSGAGPSNIKPADDYNSQRASVDTKSDNKPARPGEKVAAQTPGALFSSENTNVSANDKWRKIHSDPLYLIKQQELAALERIRKNPVKMEMLAKQVRQKMKKEQDEDDDGKQRKRRRKDTSSRKRDREHKHEKKSERNGKEKKTSRSDKHGKRQDRNVSSDSESSESEMEARPSKKFESDDRFGGTNEREYGHSDRLDREAGPARKSDMNEKRLNRDRSRHQEEDMQERGGSLNERSTRNSEAGDRYRERNDRNGRSVHYNPDERPAGLYENKSRSSGDYDKNHRSSREFYRDDRGRESPDHVDRHSRYNGSAIRPRNHGRDDRSSKDYEMDSRHQKDHHREDERKRTHD